MCDNLETEGRFLRLIFLDKIETKEPSLCLNYGIMYLMEKYDKFDKKRILIWGYGREGMSTEKFLKNHCDPLSVEVFEGQREDIDEDKYDYIIKSPGIAMLEQNSKYTSQTQIFLECFRYNTVGITGTKGKSTTSALLHHILTSAGRDTVLVGNIGEPCLNYFGDMREDTVAVFEMSCHQLSNVTVSPHVGAFLNLYEEHLDYYKTPERYFAAKANIARFMEEDDYLYVGGNVPDLPTKATPHRIDFNNVREYKMRIFGHHNSYNAHFAFRIASEVYGIDEDVIKDSIADFTGLDHRLQHIGCIDGVDYYDDSISTIPGATIEALRSVPMVRTVLIGGMDRGISYDDLIVYVSTHSEFNYIFMYDSGKRIYDVVDHLKNCCYRPTLEEAVKEAKKITPFGFGVLLSPAAASYGYFKNFEERGDVFRKLCGL